jgi:HicB family
VRAYAGRILIRVPQEVHKELALEAFKSGRSINQLCLEAVIARKALKKYDPWKAIDEIWSKNRRVNEKQLQKDILKAVAEVRRAR